MRTNTPLHLEIQRHRKNYYGLLRTSYREDGKVKHTTHGRITCATLEQLKLIQAVFRGEVVLRSPEQMPTVLKSKEYGASYAILELARELGLDKIIYSKPNKQWVQDCLAMIVGRLIYAGSKLSLSNRYKDTALWELCGVFGRVDVDEHCYPSMDYLLKRQKAMQLSLAKKHLSNNSLVLYDITSSYFEGEYEDSVLVRFGYNRDRKSGTEQIVIGLICAANGCPIAVEVFAGSTKDETTVYDKIIEVKELYGVSNIIFVGDRGIMTSANIARTKDLQGFAMISALTHPQIQELLQRNIIKHSLFDEKNIVEIIDPEDPSRRYCLCKNVATAIRETETRKAILERLGKKLNIIANSKKKTTANKIAVRVGKALANTTVGKFIDWQIHNRKLTWTLKEDAIATESLLDGCYIIVSDVAQNRLDYEELVASYKKLALVEKAFRNLKTTQLEIRPIYHKTDYRIRCHVFLCVLAYYLQWHMMERLKPLFESNGEHNERFWTFANVIERLKSIRQEEILISGITCNVITQPDEDQKKILELLKVKL